MQQVTPGIRDAFVPVEESMRETFLLSLFQGLVEGAPGRGFTRLPVKQARLALPYPTMTDPEKWTASSVVTGHLVTALRGQEEFRTTDHSDCLQEGWMAMRKRSVLMAEKALAETIAGAPVQGARRLQQETNTGVWLTVQPSTVNRAELGARE